LHHRQHGRHLIHHIGAGQHMASQLHQLGHALTVARAFQQRLGDQRSRLGEEGVGDL
jgi:hypothetical protein